LGKGSAHTRRVAAPAAAIGMNRAVDPGELSDSEVEAFAEAVDIFKAAPTSPSFFHAVPVRDGAGRLCEVRFYKDNEAQQPLAVIGIAGDGALLPLAWL
jgi:hypothetical protein